MGATKTRRAKSGTKARTNGRSTKTKVNKAKTNGKATKEVTWQMVQDGVPGSARQWLIEQLQESRDIARKAQGWCMEVQDGRFQCDLEDEIEALKKQGESKEIIAAAERAQEALREAHDTFGGACDQGGFDEEATDAAIAVLKKV